MNNKNTSYSYIHFWNPDDYLKGLIFIVAMVIFSIISFIKENGEILCILGAVIEIGVSFYFYIKWIKEYKTKEYTHHENLNKVIWIILIVLAILGIKFLQEVGIDNYNRYKVEMQYYKKRGGDMYSLYRGHYIEALIDCSLSIAYVYHLVWGIIYTIFYKKYEKDMQKKKIKNHNEAVG